VETAILVRHAESEYSARALMNGDVGVDVRLTERGREQARELGDGLRQTRLDLCATSALVRALETADLALAGSDVPRLVLPDLNDPLYGRFEAAPLDDYRAWAAASPASAAPEGGGESRVAIVVRYARAFRTLLARTDETILVVCHSLPIAYALAARDGTPPSAREPLAEYVRPYPFTAAQLERAAAVLEAWAGAPNW